MAFPGDMGINRETCDCLNSGVARLPWTAKVKTTMEVSRERKSLIAASFSIESNLFVSRWGVKARDCDQFFQQAPLIGVAAGSGTRGVLAAAPVELKQIKGGSFLYLADIK